MVKLFLVNKQKILMNTMKHSTDMYSVMCIPLALMKQKLQLHCKRLLSQKEAAYAQAKPGIVAAVASGLAACAAEKASIADLPGALNAYLAENPVPTLPQEPQMPAAPIEVEAPGEFTETEPRREDYVTAQEPTAPGEDASEEDLAAYQDALALYQEELSGQEAAYGAAQAEYQAKKAAYDFRKESYESLPARKAAYEEALAQYQKLPATLSSACAAAAESAFVRAHIPARVLDIYCSR